MKTYKGLILDKFQEEAIKAIEEGKSVIVSAPTGAGKTLVAEYAIDSALERGKEIIYTAPIKALSNQKFRDFRSLYRERVGILTGDVSINPDAPILIMTTEIFRNVILTEPQRLKNKEWVIFDEIHYLDDPERGTVWEEAIMLMPSHLKILALSATVPNIEEIASWIKNVQRKAVEVVREDKRPVPLKFYFQCNDVFFSNFKDLKKSFPFWDSTGKGRKAFLRKEPHHLRPNRISTLFKYLKTNDFLPCIYFSFSRQQCELFAQEMANFDFLNSGERNKLISLYTRLLKTFDLDREPTSLYLYDLIKKGVAFHHAGLLPTLKEVIERLFTSKLLKVIFTTETFALGINMPARTVVFDDLRKFYGSFHRNIKTRDFYQMAGRAGRRGIDREGYVFIRVNPFVIDSLSLERIIYGEPEEIRSQLRSNYATLLNLYRDMGEKIFEVYPLSFHFFQSEVKEKNEAIGLIRRKLELLKELKYITADKTLSWKGELASRVYSYELPLGELYGEGVLEKFNERELLIVISSLVYEPRRGEKKPRFNRNLRRIQGYLDSLARRIRKKEQAYKIYPLSKRFFYHLAEVSSLWFEGIKFSKLSKFTNIDEGELVRYFRMDIQVLRELLSFTGFGEDFKKKVRNILSRINRDVVDAEKQLRQEI